MPEHPEEPGAEARSRELDAAGLRGRDDVPGNSEDEEVAKPLVEHDLRGGARVRAAQDDRERLLLLRELEPPRVTRRLVAAAHAGDEAAVPFLQTCERFSGGGHPGGLRATKSSLALAVPGA